MPKYSGLYCATLSVSDSLLAFLSPRECRRGTEQWAVCPTLQIVIWKVNDPTFS